jgi:hypothetical protein
VKPWRFGEDLSGITERIRTHSQGENCTLLAVEAAIGWVNPVDRGQL